MTIKNVDFMNLGDLRFRNGGVTVEAITCTMLPFDADPAYAEYLAEEPANSPVTEDALILIECGSDGMDQALIPVQIGRDGTTRHATGHIKADTPTGPANRMLFTSYKIVDDTIVTVVKRTDGGTETRRYRFAGGTSWQSA